MEQILIGIVVIVAVYVLGLGLVHPVARRWISYWHGRGEAHQFDYYRCESCRGIVTHARIRDGGCGCGAFRLRPARLRWHERLRLLYLPWHWC